jgi:hypothetical protein
MLGNLQALSTSAGGGHLNLVPHGAGNELGVLSYGTNQTVANSYNAP